MNKAEDHKEMIKEIIKLIKIKLNIKVEIILEKDCSKGCDNLVYLLSFHNPNQFKEEMEKEEINNKENKQYMILKFPKKDKSTRPPAHSTIHLQWFIKECNKKNIKVPNVLYYDEQIIIEEYLDGIDVSELIKKHNGVIKANDEICNIYEEVGKDVKKLHEIKTKMFSEMSEIPGKIKIF
jgi:tRNA A-37 threonylcarbamoyl transferase component Bud32